jgi:hypothetical protein
MNAKSLVAAVAVVVSTIAGTGQVEARPSPPKSRFTTLYAEMSQRDWHTEANCGAAIFGHVGRC